MNIDSPQLIRAAGEVLETEARAIQALADRLDEHFVAACRLILDGPGHVVVTGMGKSGHIANKLAATLASTGTPAFFVHPAEASHGDLGMIAQHNTVLALSNSGETEEVLRLLPGLKRLGVSLIAMTGNSSSTLAKQADVHLDTSVDREACPLGLAPTASTSAQLALGDALAIALLDARGFTAEDFARSHPAGSLGRRLLLRISDLMHTGEELPIIHKGASIAEAIMEMTRSRLGMCAVLGADQTLVGIVTDGDLRRHVDKLGDIRANAVENIMTADPRTIRADELAASAVELMQNHRIQGVLVTDAAGQLVGALNFQDLLQAGVV